MAKALVEAAFAGVFDTDAGGRLVNLEGDPPVPGSLRRQLPGPTDPEDRVTDVLFPDPRQALVRFRPTASGGQPAATTLSGRAVLVDDSWVVTHDTFCRDVFVSDLGSC